MVSVEEFHRQFVQRHDFYYDDEEFLSQRFPYIKFNNIPEAWVCEIERFLSSMKEPQKVREVSQVLGFLVLDFGNVSENDHILLRRLQNSLEVLDIDLHSQLEEGIILN